MTAAHARVRPPERNSFVPRLLALVVVLAVALVALITWQRGEQLKANERAIAESAEALDAWQVEALTLLARPPVDLAALASPADADGLAALTAACDQVQEHANAVAAAASPTIPATRAPEDFPGRAALEARRVAAADALLAYQEQVAAAAASSATFCASYPPIVQAQWEAPATGPIDALLAECRGSASGCIPTETDTWGEIADAVGPAYIEPAQRRAEVFAACPAASAAAVCALVVEQANAIQPLYTAYADALRSGESDNVETARADLESALNDQQAAFDQAVRDANPGAEIADPAATFAAMLAGEAVDIDAAFEQAETAFLSAVG